MAEEDTQKKFWELYEKLPEELKEAIFSEETAKRIEEICETNQVGEGDISEVARYVGRVLLGALPPDELEDVLVKKVGLEGEVAKRVGHGAERFIFAPLMEELALLHNKSGLGITRRLAEESLERDFPKQKTETAAPIQEESVPKREPSASDTYREQFNETEEEE